MTPIFQLIKDHREIAGLTQAQLARLAGVGKTVVWDLEHGKESVQWDTLQKIFHVLNVSVEWRSPLLERKASKMDSAASSSAAPSHKRPRST